MKARFIGKPECWHGIYEVVEKFSGEAFQFTLPDGRKATELKENWRVIQGLNPAQLGTLQMLYAVLGTATDNGLLDLIQPNNNDPDSINDLCDAVADMVKDYQ